MKEELWDYDESPYEKQLLNFFGNHNCSVQKIDKRFSNISFTFICFYNRSGSNMLAEFLGKSNINIAGENLKPEMVKRISSKRKLKSLVDYIFHIANKKSIDGNFAIKCSYSSLIFLYKNGYFGNIFQNYKFVHIKRKSVFKQVVSFEVANKTRQWTSYQDKKNKITDINIENNEIIKRAKKIVTTDIKFKVLLEFMQADWTEVNYEDIVIDPIKSVSELLVFLSLNHVEVDINKLKTKKQKDSLKEKLLKKFFEEANRPNN
jgi:LPS sulfotransferase NodH